jgi:hypothetical protein
MSDGLIHADDDLAAACLRRVVQEIEALQTQLPAIRRAGELLAASWRNGSMLRPAQPQTALQRDCVNPAGARRATGASK